MWTLDKFLNPAHASKVFEHFYSIGNLNGGVLTVLAAVEMLIIVLFLLGLFKDLTYLLVFCLHALSTLSSYSQYLSPWTDRNLLFFTAWPMLASCAVLYYLRAYDVRYIWKVR